MIIRQPYNLQQTQFTMREQNTSKLTIISLGKRSRISWYSQSTWGVNNKWLTYSLIQAMSVKCIPPSNLKGCIKSRVSSWLISYVHVWVEWWVYICNVSSLNEINQIFILHHLFFLLFSLLSFRMCDDFQWRFLILTITIHDLLQCSRDCNVTRWESNKKSTIVKKEEGYFSLKSFH